MTADYPTGEVAATPEYVLEVFREWQRINVAAGEAEELKLTPDTPFWEWQDSLLVDCWGRGGFGGAMNEAWEVDISPAEWRAFERSATTLGDLCRLIASRAMRPVIRSWKHVTGDCLPAGAFLTVRAMLAAAGEDPKQLTPSTPLAPYLTRRYDSLWFQLARLVPGCGPLPAETGLGGVIRGWLAIGAVLSLLVSIVAPAVGVVLLLACVVGLNIASRFLGFWQFPNSDIRTFRDLAYCLAGQRPRQQIQPTP